MAKRILIVEDDMILSMVNKKHVEILGHQVVQAVRNGKDAIEAVKTHSPDLILMDIRIEGDIDGIETMIEIRKFADVPVVFLSGNSDPATKMKANQLNALSFLVKPISIEDLKLVLNKD